MPRRRSQSEQRAVVIALFAVVLGLVALFGLSVLSGRGDVELSNLGDRDFEAGDAERLATRIAEDREPFLFPDASPNRSRPIYVDHAGGPPTEGWVAILAVDDGCELTYTGNGYVDCEGNEFPRDGTGLTQYETRVDDGKVIVDLRSELE